MLLSRCSADDVQQSDVLEADVLLYISIDLQHISVVVTNEHILACAGKRFQVATKDRIAAMR